MAYKSQRDEVLFSCTRIKAFGSPQMNFNDGDVGILRAKETKRADLDLTSELWWEKHATKRRKGNGLRNKSKCTGSLLISRK